jgi:chemotaxis protein methyltransferase CheR
MWQLDAGVRSMVRFRQFNLLRDFDSLGPFDIVFCRNVLIYLDQATKTSVLDRIADIMEPDGFLVLGASETMIGLTDKLKMIEGMRSLHAPLCGPDGKRSAGRPAALKARIA